MTPSSLERPAELNGQRVTCAILSGERQVGEIDVAAGAHHLFVHDLRMAPGVADEVATGALAELLALYPEGRPPRFTHTGVSTPGLLRWYQQGPLVSGMVLTGTLGARRLTYDPAGCVPVGDDDDVQVVVHWDPPLMESGGAVDPDIHTVARWFEHPNHMLRVAAVRRVSLDASLPEQLRQDTHLLALLNASSAVRQLAAVCLSDATPHASVRVPLDRLLSFLEAPLQLWCQLGMAVPASSSWTPARTRRDARYAVGWILANLVRCHGRRDRHAALWRDVGGRLRQAIADATPEREQQLRRLVLAEYEDDPDVHYALGGDGALSLLDWLRFAVLRAHLIAELGLTDTDAFAWLIRDARLLVSHLDDPRITRHVCAEPDLWEDRPAVHQLPKWMYRQPV
jgi:hypothetical protein